jgi:hypothetical protein
VAFFSVVRLPLIRLSGAAPSKIFPAQVVDEIGLLDNALDFFVLFCDYILGVGEDTGILLALEVLVRVSLWDLDKQGLFDLVSSVRDERVILEQARLLLDLITYVELEYLISSQQQPVLSLE